MDENMASQITMAEQSRLLRLPAELRNAIYELVAESGNTISFDRDAITSPSSTLAAVDHQLRQEYLPILDLRGRVKRASKVQARVVEFEFDDLSRFLVRLPTLVSGEAKRELEVTLVFDKAECSASLEDLRRWLDDCGNTHRAALASITYVLEVDWTCCSMDVINNVDCAVGHFCNSYHFFADGWLLRDAIGGAASMRLKEQLAHARAEAASMKADLAVNKAALASNEAERARHAEGRAEIVAKIARYEARLAEINVKIARLKRPKWVERWERWRERMRMVLLGVAVSSGVCWLVGVIFRLAN
ncbi:hypothetical protein LTR85_001346 [Meristemomyces frigidus]|nr:hypothetical protein LTR85_001346 [Meristemomyces frigidus]